jgi:predicted neuraminidase
MNIHPISRVWCFTLCLSLPILVATAVNETATPSFSSRSIFPAQEKHVHSSSIVELPDGALLAVWFHGSGERTADDVVIQGARLPNRAAAWSPVFLAADTPHLPDCNPVVFLDGRQRLWLVWVVVQANRWEQSLLKYRVADDYLHDGPPRWTWQDVILLRPGPEFAQQLRDGFRELGYRQRMWAEYARPYDRLLVEAASDPIKRDIGWMPRALPLRLIEGPRAGRILLPLYSDGFNISLIAISDDDGAQWRPSRPMVGLGNVQPTLALRRDGTIVAFLRDAGLAPGRVQISESRDHGDTWTVARDTDLPNPGGSVAVVTLQDGRWLLVLNDTETGRHQLAITVSEDEGRTWDPMRYLEKSEPGVGRHGYPTAIQGRDGRVHVTYTHSTAHDNTIQHVAFDPAWLAGD